MTTIATIPAPPRGIGRSLKTLIPLIQRDLQEAERAGLEYFLDAGAKLIEAKPGVSGPHWSPWLRKNFDIGKSQAYQYMRAYERAAELRKMGVRISGMTMSELTGEAARKKEYQKGWSKVKTATSKVDVEAVSREQQSYAEEIEMHRTLALKLVDSGYKALATRLHPDKGGSAKAMTRLNRVRDELKEVAETRRFV